MAFLFSYVSQNFDFSTKNKQTIISSREQLGRDDGMETPLISQWLDYTKKQSSVEKKLEEMLKKNNQLTTSEYYALYQLKQNGRHMRLNDLGNYLCLSQSALSRLIIRLEDRKPSVIERRDCADDKRGVYIALTEEGSQLVSSVAQEVNALLKEYFI